MILSPGSGDDEAVGDAGMVLRLESDGVWSPVAIPPTNAALWGVHAYGPGGERTVVIVGDERRMASALSTIVASARGRWEIWVTVWREADIIANTGAGDGRLA